MCLFLPPQSKFALTSTSEGVLAAINLKSGKTMWRTVYEQSECRCVSVSINNIQ